jgi:VanZ family protein
MVWELICFIAILTGVSIGCLLPTGWLPVLPHDKWLHFGAFAVLTSLALRIAVSPAQQLCWIVGLILTGWLIEVFQKLVPGRNFCWRDMAANVAGIATAAALALLLRAL